ncbi:MAG: ribonuclease P protein component 3 [Candidatus Aenigmatarchaeota archaeon]|jgi:ribonuclease P/MRP protein subunit RPP1
MFFDLHVHSAFSSGESSLEDIVKTAKELGYKGIGFISYPLKKEEEEILRAEVNRISNEYNFEIYVGFEANNKLELKHLLNRRRELDLILVRGGTNLMNRVAVENRGVDILTHPNHQRKDCGINHILARLAKENEVAIEINFREILNTEGLIRKNVLANHAEIIRLYKKFKFPLIVSSGALSHWQIKDPKVLISYLVTLGLEMSEAKKALKDYPKMILERSKERKSEKWVMPGVKLV